MKPINISALLISTWFSGLISSSKLLVLFVFIFKKFKILIFFKAYCLKLIIVTLLTKKLLIILKTNSILNAINTPNVKAINVEFI